MNAGLESLKTQLESLLDEISDIEICHAGYISSLDSPRKLSAVNFLHYNVLRMHDLRALQEELAINGLSSLDQCETAVKSSIDSILNLIYRLLEEVPTPNFSDISSREEGRMLLLENFRRLFGDRKDLYPGIMVTMPAEAAHNTGFIRKCLKNGMTCMRVDCSQDTPNEWFKMIANLRSLQSEMKLSCKVLMDLPGPNLKTGRIVNDVIKIKPVRDRYGKIISYGQFLISVKEIDSELPYIIVELESFKRLTVGEYYYFNDSRGASRKIKVSKLQNGSYLCECIKTAYINKKVMFSDHSNNIRFYPYQIISPDPYLFFKEGEKFYLTADRMEERMVSFKEGQRLPAVSCKCPDIFKSLKEGEKIFFDEGKIEGVIKEAHSDYVVVKVKKTFPNGAKLKSGKGINLPESQLNLPPFGANDIELVKFISKYADIIGYSFAQKAENVKDLHALLKKVGGGHLGLILKIETVRSFAELPGLLLEAQKFPSSGIMLVRGELAVECGFVRLSEIQDEISWLAQSMHMPIIWATHVLDNLVESGLPSRAEISDVYLNNKTDMLMVNKGPFIHEAIKIIRTVNKKINRHMNKKYAQLRKLKVVDCIRTSDVV